MHAEFRPLVTGYALFVIVQFLSGCALYFLRVGPTQADAFEYYRGSEAALERFPQRPDRFLPEKTMTGILKTQAPHTIAFGTLFFILVHLVRSLGAAPGVVGIVSGLFAFFAAVDFLFPFLMLTGVEIFYFLRFPVILLFAAAGSLLAILLCLSTRKV